MAVRRQGVCRDIQRDRISLEALDLRCSFIGLRRSRKPSTWLRSQRGSICMSECHDVAIYWICSLHYGLEGPLIDDQGQILVHRGARSLLHPMIPTTSYSFHLLTSGTVEYAQNGAIAYGGL